MRGAQHNPGSVIQRLRLPAPGGLWIFVWKAWLQSWRTLSFMSIISWLALFGLSLGMVLSRGWGLWIGFFIVWGIWIGQICPRRYLSDLSLWALFKPLPFSARSILLADIAGAVCGAALLGWLAYALSSLIGWKTNLSFAVLAPGAISILTLTAVFDIHRHIKTEALLAGHPASMGPLGLYLGLVLAGIPLALANWIAGWASSGVVVWVVSLFGLFLSLGIAYLMWHLAALQLRKIK